MRTPQRRKHNVCGSREEGGPGSAGEPLPWAQGVTPGPGIESCIRLPAGSPTRDSIPGPGVTPWAAGRCSTSEPPTPPSSFAFLRSCL